MVLWEIASRENPFKEAKNNDILLKWIGDGEQEDVPETCSFRYGELIKCCWKKPDERPQVTEALKFLEQHADKIKKEGKESLSKISRN